MKKSLQYRCNECKGYSTPEADVPADFQAGDSVQAACTICNTPDTIKYLGSNMWESTYDRERRGK